jgi:hypothetical protein
MVRVFSVFAAPLLCLGVLGGIAVGNWERAPAAPAEAFQERAAAAIARVPYVVGDWVGTDMAVPPAAVALLKPNAILSRRYVCGRSSLADGPIDAELLIVQCRDSRDMAGHYPPNCYPAAGQKLLSSRPFRFAVGAIAVHGIEYHFAPAPSSDTDSQSRCVYDFFVVPGKGIVADIAGVRASAADRDRRGFGAAQIQLVISDRFSQAERQHAFADLLGPQEPLLRTLIQAGIP